MDLSGYATGAPVQRTPLWPASWLPAVEKSKGSKSVGVQRAWVVYDDRLSVDDVSRAWLVWSGAAETALADAYQFSGVLSRPEADVFRRRFKAVMDVLDSTTAQRDKILAAGPLVPCYAG